MGASLDMNNYRVINAGAPVADGDLVRLVDLEGLETVLSAGAALRGNNLSDLLDPLEALSNLGGDEATNINFNQSGTGAVVRSTQDKLRDFINVKDFFAVGDTVCDALDKAITAAAGRTVFIEGSYDWPRTVYLPSGTRLVFASGSVMSATANGLTFFKNPVGQASFGVVVENGTLDGNGFTGVTGYNMRDWRVNAGLINPGLVNMEFGVIGDYLCWSTFLDRPYFQNVVNPVVQRDGSRFIINDPYIDDMDVGILVETGPTFTTYGPKIYGGAIQNGRIGLQDEGYQTALYATYFETCTEADIFANGAIFPGYHDVNHAAGVGTVGVKGRNCVGAYITNPFMGASQRTFGLFDFDSSNEKCRADYVTNLVSFMNAPLGDVTGLISLTPITTSFQPYVAGDGAVIGGTTYTTRKGHVTDHGDRLEWVIELAWTGHTEAGGNTYIYGIPAALQTGMDGRALQVTTIGFTDSGIQRVAIFQTGGDLLLPFSVNGSGAQAYMPIPAAGTILIQGTLYR